MKKFLVAFDINGTLVRRFHKADSHVKKLISMDIGHDFRYKHYFIYNRPHLDVLIKFLNSHDTDYVLWTAAKANNAEYLIKHLKCMGIGGGLDHYSQQDCKVGGIRIESDPYLHLWVKDLRVISKKYAIDVKNCILVDDSIDKSVHDQNFLCCPEFVPGEEDTGIIQICKHLDKFFGCKENCIAKMY